MRGRLSWRAERLLGEHCEVQPPPRALAHRPFNGRITCENGSLDQTIYSDARILNALESVAGAVADWFGGTAPKDFDLPPAGSVAVTGGLNRLIGQTVRRCRAC